MASQFNPRIERLREQVSGLAVDNNYRKALLRAIDTYMDQILTRPEYAADEGWDDLEAIQQVTMGDMMEGAICNPSNNEGKSK